MRKLTVVAVLCCALLTACQMVIEPPNPIEPAPQLDEPIALAVGETATLADAVSQTVIKLTFVGVRSDSRCPKDSMVMCVWSGAVEVEMTAAVDDRTETFGLTGITDYDGVVEGSITGETDSTQWYFAGYYFVLVRVTPYPAGDTRPLPEEYVATAIIRRAAEPLPTPTVEPATIEHLIDETGLPLLCVSEKAMTEWAAGATEDNPIRLTPPMAAGSIPDIQAATEICAVLFGDDWRVADVGDVDGMWSQFVPADLSVWIGDSAIGSIVEH